MKVVFRVDASIQMGTGHVMRCLTLAQVLKENGADTDSTYYPKRSPKDSEIDVNKGISEQFDLIRICDPDRFPVFFYKNGERFNITIKKDNE